MHDLCRRPRYRAQIWIVNWRLPLAGTRTSPFVVPGRGMQVSVRHALLHSISRMQSSLESWRILKARELTAGCEIILPPCLYTWLQNGPSLTAYLFLGAVRFVKRGLQQPWSSSCSRNHYVNYSNAFGRVGTTANLYLNCGLMNIADCQLPWTGVRGSLALGSVKRAGISMRWKQRLFSALNRMLGLSHRHGAIVVITSNTKLLTV